MPTALIHERVPTGLWLSGRGGPSQLSDQPRVTLAVLGTVRSYVLEHPRRTEIDGRVRPQHRFAGFGRLRAMGHHWSSGPIVLGCGSFGGIGGARDLIGRGLDEDASMAALDKAASLGIIMLDTAERYADGPASG